MSSGAGSQDVKPAYLPLITFHLSLANLVSELLFQLGRAFQVGLHFGFKLPAGGLEILQLFSGMGQNVDDLR
jgi:hypothetical protein